MMKMMTTTMMVWLLSWTKFKKNHSDKRKLVKRLHTIPEKNKPKIWINIMVVRNEEAGRESSDIKDEEVKRAWW